MRAFSEKIYGFLLRAYPRGYRTRYAQPMAQLFRDRLGEVRTHSNLVALWTRTLADWVVSVPARHWEQLLSRLHRSPFADSARRCFVFASAEASSFSRREITVEHLLLGIMREERSQFSAAAQEAVCRAIESSEPAGRRVPPMEDLRLSDQTRRVIASAKQIAAAAGRQEISPSDLVAGIQLESNTMAARLLREHLADRG